MNSRFYLYGFLALTLTGCAYAPSNVPPLKVFVYQVCLPDLQSTPLAIHFRSAGAGGGAQSTVVVAKSPTNQPIFEGYIYPQDDGVLVKMPPDDANAQPRVYLFPIRARVTDGWSEWLAPAQLDYGEFPLSMDKFNFYRGLDAAAQAKAPKIRWRTEFVAPHNLSRTDGKTERYSAIPAC